MKQVRVHLSSMLGLAVILGSLSAATATEEATDLAECIAQLEAEAKAAEEEDTISTEATLHDSISRFDECIKRIKLQNVGTVANSGNESQSSDSLGGQNQIVAETLSQSLQAFDQALAEQQKQLDQEQVQRDLQIAIEQAKQTQDNSPFDEASDQLSEQTLEEHLISQTSLPHKENVRSNDGQHESSERVPLDPEDEDIVLKTIRKAAESDQDPETKADLWEEYYEYADKK